MPTPSADYSAHYTAAKAAKNIWRSTGLCAAAAELVAVTLPQALVGNGDVRRKQVVTYVHA